MDIVHLWYTFYIIFIFMAIHLTCCVGIMISMSGINTLEATFGAGPAEHNTVQCRL